MPMYDDLPLSFGMTDLKISEQPSDTTDTETYYSVLGVVRDRGIPFMWTGAALMMAGLVFSFYLKPRRLWVVVENGNVYIGGRTKGDPGEFGEFVSKTVRHLRSGNSK